jgi:hypothetical protein
MKLVKKPQGFYELENEVGSLCCPFKNSIPIQQGNELKIIPQQCNSLCPHFTITFELKVVGLSCGSMLNTLNFSEVVEQKIHTNNLNII